MLSEKLVIEHIHGQGLAGRSVQHYSNGGFLTTPITFLTHAYLTGRNAVQLAVLGLQYFCITAREGILITRNNHTFMPGHDFGYLREKSLTCQNRGQTSGTVVSTTNSKTFFY